MVSFEEKDRYAFERDAMIQHHLRGRDITDERVLEAMRQVPRENFIVEKYAAQAYADNPLPIGMGQTISQPYIVALMSQCLKLTGDEEVLEIGTGSGYQTAVLAQLCNSVYTVERFEELSLRAQTALEGAGVVNTRFFIGDGSSGWPEDKQFDRILVTAGIPEIPIPLTNQLKMGGLLVAPLGSQWSQELVIYEKTAKQPNIITVCGCRFVPLIGKYGFGESHI